MIKAIIFDLDDTLFDQKELREKAIEQSLKAMIENGLKCNFEQGIIKFNEIINENPLADKFEELVLYFNGHENEKSGNEKTINELAKLGKEVYKNADFDSLEIYSDAIETLDYLKENFKLFLVTEGTFYQQNRKIDAIKIRECFDAIYFNEEGSKTRDFKNILNKFNKNEVIVIGDRIDKEIKDANNLGIKTIRILRGIYSKVIPRNELEIPSYTITSLKEIKDIINKINYGKKQLKIVAIGGGTGLPTISEGLRKYTDNLTLIVTVTDSGRSSGTLRKELNVLPPGDIRNCLISLSNSEELLCDLFRYRFHEGSLEGHNFGNLFIAALTKLTGSFELAINEASKILKLKGKVLPSTFDNVHICAELDDGTLIEEENNIIDRHNDRIHLRSPIKKVFLKPTAKANELALQAINEADLIVICPGSLFTSIITNLLVDGLSEAINNSKAKKVYVCNIMTQVSQTYGYKASNHIKRVLEHINLDFVILNNEKPNQELLDSYAGENAYLVENDFDEIEKLNNKVNNPGIKIITEKLLDHSIEKKPLWEKKNLLRHDPDKIARVLIGLVEKSVN